MSYSRTPKVSCDPVSKNSLGIVGAVYFAVFIAKGTAMHSLNFARAEDFRMQTFAQILSNVRSGIGRHTLDQNLTLVSRGQQKGALHVWQ